jgi:hypothetical protein
VTIAATCLIAGAMIGPPAVGAVSSLFWSTAADANDVQRVAGRLYDRTRLNPAAEADDDHLTQQACGAASFKRLSPGDVALISALDHYRYQLLRAEYDNLGVEALMGLPAPVLGALDGCVGGSPASSFCLSYISKIAERATSVPEATRQAWLTAADKEFDAAWCIANPPEQAKSRP